MNIPSKDNTDFEINPAFKDKDFDVSSSTNYLSSISTLLTSTLGITILLMPKLFHQGGVLFCTVQILIMGLAIYISSSMICSIAHVTKSTSYYETIENVCGKYKAIPNTFFIILLCGNILVYHAFVLKNLIPMVNTLFMFNYVEKSVEWITLGAMLTFATHFLILPFLFSRKLKIVKQISNFCSVAMIFSVFIVILAFFKPSLFDLPKNPIDWQFVDFYKFDGIYVCAGYYLLSFTFQQIVIEVSNEIRPRTGYSTDIVIFTNCMVSSFLYIIVSFVGYLSIYNEPNLDQMNNYITYLIVDLRNRNPWLFMTNFLVIINVCFANILNYIPAIKFVNSILNFKKNKRKMSGISNATSPQIIDIQDNEESQFLRYKNRAIVWIIFLVVLFFSLMTTVLDIKMDTIFNIVSAFGGPIVLLVMPAVFYLYMVHKGDIVWAGNFDYVVGLAVLTLGVAMWFISIFATLQDI